MYYETKHGKVLHIGKVDMRGSTRPIKNKKYTDETTYCYYNSIGSLLGK